MAMAVAMDREESIGAGTEKVKWACGATWCREAWKGGFVGMSGSGDLGMRALFPFALDQDCVLTPCRDDSKI